MGLVGETLAKRMKRLYVLDLSLLGYALLPVVKLPSQSRKELLYPGRQHVSSVSEMEWATGQVKGRSTTLYHLRLPLLSQITMQASTSGIPEGRP